MAVVKSDTIKEAGLDAEVLRTMYRHMVRSRVLDERMWLLNRQGRAAFWISAMGHEAVQVALGMNIRAGDDWIAPYYRDLALTLVVGMTPKDHLLSILARADDPNSGSRQMPAHFGCRPLNIISTGSPVATQLLHAAGIGLAMKNAGTDQVVVTSLGEGSTSEGDFHEAVSFAATHKLPVIFLVQNNGYAISVPLDKQMPTPDVADRAKAYGIPGVIVDGGDPVASFVACRDAVARARRGEGPTLIEAKVQRLTSHSSDDDEKRYRNADEISDAKKKDCLTIFRATLEEQGVLKPGDAEEIRAEMVRELEKGMEEAEAAPETDPATASRWVYGEDPPSVQEPSGPVSTKNMVEAVREAMRGEMRRDDTVMVFGEDVGPKGGVFGATDGLNKEFGDARVLDSPLAEACIVGVGIGAAMYGTRFIAEIQFQDFILPAVDQIINEAAKMRYRSNNAWHVPMTIRAPFGGGIHGALYHSQSLEAMFAHIPGLKVVVPSNPYDAKGLLISAIRDNDPVMVFEHKRGYRSLKAEIPDGEYTVPIGKAKVVRQGDDICILTYGMMVHTAVEAADVMAKEGFECEIVDLRTLRPLDVEAIVASARKCGKVLVLQETNLAVSMASEVAAIVAEQCFEQLDAPVMRLGGPEIPAMPWAPPLEHFYLIDTDKLTAKLRELAAY